MHAFFFIISKYNSIFLNFNNINFTELTADDDDADNDRKYDNNNKKIASPPNVLLGHGLPLSPLNDTKKSILKSKSGCVGLFPSDLNSELKSRLEKSKHASVSNLKKTLSSNINTPTTDDNNQIKRSIKKTDDDLFILKNKSDEHNNISPSKNLAKILRNVTKENCSSVNKVNNNKQLIGGEQHHNIESEDARNLVRNLVSLEKGIAKQQIDNENKNIATDTKSTTSEGESSGGREIATIIKNSAVARRRRQNDG